MGRFSELLQHQLLVDLPVARPSLGQGSDGGSLVSRPSLGQGWAKARPSLLVDLPVARSSLGQGSAGSSLRSSSSLAAAFLGEPLAPPPGSFPSSSSGNSGAPPPPPGQAVLLPAGAMPPAPPPAAADQQPIYDGEALAPSPFAKAQQEKTLRPVCDKLGRISANSPDGFVCVGDDACVTSMPSDFCARLARSTPGMPAFCYGQAQFTGRPWCIKAGDIHRYAGPIELKCSGSGPGAMARGHPSGCWWLKEAANEDIQRLSGPIRMRNLPASLPRGLYVDDVPGVAALSEKQAEHWILNGSLGPLPNGGRRNGEAQEFLESTGGPGRL